MNIHSARYLEKYGYVARLQSKISQCYSMSDDKLPSYGLSYISWNQRYDVYVFENLLHLVNELTLERRHQMHGGDMAHFVGWHSVKYYAIPPCYGSQLYVPFSLGGESIKVCDSSMYRNLQCLGTIRISLYGLPSMTYYSVSHSQNAAHFL